MSIAIEKGRITASIRNSPFDAVLEQLASQTGAAFVPADDLGIRAIRVSAELAGVPLDEGLRRTIDWWLEHRTGAAPG